MPGHPTTSNELVEQQLASLLGTLEQKFDADLLCYVGPIADGMDDGTRTLVEERRKVAGTRDRLGVILTTTGGYIETAHRIVETLRHHYRFVNFIIPNYAYSAGTVLAMSGDEIHMDYYSRLGPIDPQIQTSKGRFVPALGYLKRWEELLQKATNGSITTAELQLMVSGFDQAELYQYEHAQQLSVKLLKEWLVKYKFKNWTETQERKLQVTEVMKEQRAEEIGIKLNDTDSWHSHSHGISMAVLRDELKLVIDDLDEDPDRAVLLKEYYALITDYMARRGTEIALHTVCRYYPLG